MANEKTVALREARKTLGEMYDIDLNETDIFGAIKELGVSGFEKSFKEIKKFVSGVDRKLVESKNAAQIGLIMANARTNANWDNPLYRFTKD